MFLTMSSNDFFDHGAFEIRKGVKIITPIDNNFQFKYENYCFIPLFGTTVSYYTNSIVIICRHYLSNIAL